MAPERGPYCQWVPLFHDEHERKSRRLEASRAEREGQRRAIDDIFNYQRVHQAQFQRVPGTTNDLYVHVKVMSDTVEEKLVVPDLAEQTEDRPKSGFDWPRRKTNRLPK